MDKKAWILANPKKIRFILKVHNMFFGSNKFKVQKGNEVVVCSAKLKKTKIIIHGTNNRVFIDDFCRLTNCTIHIFGNHNKIHLSKRTSFEATEFHIEDDYNEISIGYHTSTHGKTHFAAIEGTKILIGEDCMFANDIHFRTGDSHSIIDAQGNRINPSEDIVIGNHVWIGTKVVCLKGVFIPDNSIVGAGSLLTKKFTEENSIYAGTPAKLVKQDINWLRERIKINGAGDV